MKLTYQDYTGQVGELETDCGYTYTQLYLLQLRGDIDRQWFDGYETINDQPTDRPNYDRQYEIEWHPGLICECGPMGDDMDFGLVVLDKDGIPCRKKNGEWEPLRKCPYCKSWVSWYDRRAKSRIPDQDWEWDQKKIPKLPIGKDIIRLKYD